MWLVSRRPDRTCRPGSTSILIAIRHGAQPNQLRRIEQLNPSELPALRQITSASTPDEVKASLGTLAQIYLALRDNAVGELEVNSRAEFESRRFLAES
jgi:hypothetical protein